MIDQTSLAELSLRLGYTFRTPSLLIQALTHKSASVGFDYQRLEFLGDAVLGLAVAEGLYVRHPHADEGQLTQWRANVVNRDFLAQLAITLMLPQYLQIGADQEKIRQNPSVLADVLEAVFAAVHLDGGWVSAQAVVIGLYGPYLDDIEKWGINKDPKSQLQEYLQARKWPLPEYALILQTGPQHRPSFVVQANLPSFHSRKEKPIFSAFGEGESRKDAERQAAQRTLDYLQSVDMDLDALS